MNRKEVDKLLVKASEALQSDKIGIVQNNQIKKTFVAYTAALGTAIIQNGLLPALAFYCSKSENGIERRKVVRTIAAMLDKSPDEQVFFKECLRIYNSDKSEYAQQTKKVVNASVALKMMMRTYKLNENEK